MVKVYHRGREKSSEKRVKKESRPMTLCPPELAFRRKYKNEDPNRRKNTRAQGLRKTPDSG